jgi:hypothetical protein
MLPLLLLLLMPLPMLLPLLLRLLLMLLPLMLTTLTAPNAATVVTAKPLLLVLAMLMMRLLPLLRLRLMLLLLLLPRTLNSTVLLVLPLLTHKLPLTTQAVCALPRPGVRGRAARNTTPGRTPPPRGAAAGEVHGPLAPLAVTRRSATPSSGRCGLTCRGWGQEAPTTAAAEDDKQEKTRSGSDHTLPPPTCPLCLPPPTEGGVGATPA